MTFWYSKGFLSKSVNGGPAFVLETLELVARGITPTLAGGLQKAIGRKIDFVGKCIVESTAIFFVMILNLFSTPYSVLRVQGHSSSQIHKSSEYEHNMILSIFNKMKVHPIYLTTLKFSIKKRFLNRFSKIEQVR